MILLKHRMAKAGIPERLQNCRIENFETPTKGHADALAFVCSWLGAFDPAAGLLLCGRVGTGKTHLAVAALIELAMDGRPAHYCNIPHAFAELKRGFDRPKAEHDDSDGVALFEAAMAAPVALLDDLGVEKDSEWRDEMVYDLINHRWEHERATIITTNLEPDQIAARYGERIASRIAGMCQSHFVRVRDDWRRTVNH